MKTQKLHAFEAPYHFECRDPLVAKAIAKVDPAFWTSKDALFARDDITAVVVVDNPVTGAYEVWVTDSGAPHIVTSTYQRALLKPTISAVVSDSGDKGGLSSNHD